MNYKYRKLQKHWRKRSDSQWIDGTAEDKERIERSAPNRFEFLEVSKPEPTPNMVKEPISGDEKATKKSKK